MFVAFEKPARGHYSYKATLIAANGGSYTPQQLTVLYKNILEDTIRKNPSNYLWSHRRWRHEWKEEYGEILQ